MRKAFRDLLESKEKYFGTILQFPCPEMIEILAASGSRYVIIDNEHSQATYEQTLTMLRTADSVGLPAMIRLPEISEDAIKKALDMGFSALRLPTVSSAEEVKRLVSYAKFAPEGIRGACPYVRANKYGAGNKQEFYRKANEELVIAVNIEGPEGIANMESIIRQDGIDIINVGRADLAVALGFPGEITHPKVEKAVRDVANLAYKYKKCSGAFIRAPEDAASYADCPGITHFLVLPPEELLISEYRKIFEGIVKSIENT